MGLLKVEHLLSYYWLWLFKIVTVFLNSVACSGIISKSNSLRLAASLFLLLSLFLTSIHHIYGYFLNFEQFCSFWSKNGQHFTCILLLSFFLNIMTLSFPSHLKWTIVFDVAFCIVDNTKMEIFNIGIKWLTLLCYKW